MFDRTLFDPNDATARFSHSGLVAPSDWVKFLPSAISPAIGDRKPPVASSPSSFPTSFPDISKMHKGIAAMKEISRWRPGTPLPQGWVIQKGPVDRMAEAVDLFVDMGWVDIVRANDLSLTDIRYWTERGVKRGLLISSDQGVELTEGGKQYVARRYGHFKLPLPLNDEQLPSEQAVLTDAEAPPAEPVVDHVHEGDELEIEDASTLASHPVADARPQLKHYLYRKTNRGKIMVLNLDEARRRVYGDGPIEGKPADIHNSFWDVLEKIRKEQKDTAAGTKIPPELCHFKTIDRYVENYTKYRVDLAAWEARHLSK